MGKWEGDLITDKQPASGKLSKLSKKNFCTQLLKYTMLMYARDLGEGIQNLLNKSYPSKR